jgi:hypothetical protein
MPSESEPIRENNPTPNAERKPDTQQAQSEIDVSRTLGVPSPPPAKTHCAITCKTEKDSWDHAKTGAEIVGIVLLAVYTGYTIKMYQVNKESADAAKSASDTAARQLAAFETKEAAHLEVDNFQAKIADLPDGTIKISAIYVLKNVGATEAVHITSSEESPHPGCPIYRSYTPMTPSFNSPWSIQVGHGQEANNIELVRGWSKIPDGSCVNYFIQFAYYDIFEGTKPHSLVYCVNVRNDGPTPSASVCHGMP